VIPFRTQRVATSVVNRILNIRDGLEPVPSAGAPSAPDPLPEAAELDARIAAPKAPVDADPQTAAGIALGPLAK
jgi:hypothetical protein